MTVRVRSSESASRVAVCNLQLRIEEKEIPATDVAKAMSVKKERKEKEFKEYKKFEESKE